MFGSSVLRILAAAVIGLVVFVGATLASLQPASATWSIVAVDPETGRVGAVMASCVPAGLLGEPDSALVPIVLVPGRSAGVAQGSINPESPVGLRQLLSDGASPQAAIDALLEIDDQPTARQFGIASLPSEEVGTAGQGDQVIPAVAYTGDDVEPERGDAVGATVSVQGVLLADKAVISRALEAFDRALVRGEPLEQALVAGLVAGSEAGGDRRCDAQTALFAHLAVADPGDDPFVPSLLVTVTVDEGDGQNPVPMLADALAEGRSGWVDAGLNDPVGIPRLAVMAVGTALAIAAFVTIRKGIGSPSARR